MAYLCGNKYDFAIMLIIASEAAGLLYAPLTILRLFSILLIPFLLVTNTPKYRPLPHYVVVFFCGWFLFSVVSLAWTDDFTNGVKALIYNFSSIILFISLFRLSQRSSNPIKYIVYGWCLLFVITTPIALNEFFTDSHLSLSVHDEYVGVLVDQFGNRHSRKYASVTYGNLNGYNVVMCYCLPFILFNILSNQKHKIINWGVLLGIIYLILMNASRGAAICLSIAIILFLICAIRQKRINKWTMYGFILAVVIIISINASEFFYQISERLLSSSLTDDEYRTVIYRNGYIILKNSLFMGCGIGGLQTALHNIDPGIIPAMHNMFFEFLFQYGIIPFIFFVIFNYNIIANLIKSYNVQTKYIGIIVALYLLPLFVINSGYVASQSLWIWYASLMIIGYPKKQPIRS